VLLIGDTLLRAFRAERAGPGSLVLLIGETLPRASRAERTGPGSLVLLIGDTLLCASRSERAGPGSLVLLIGDTLLRAACDVGRVCCRIGGRGETGLAFTRYCHHQYCMVYGIQGGGRLGGVYCAIVVQ